MNKGTLVRKVNEKLDHITNAIYELRDLLDDTENDDLSQLGNDFVDTIEDYIINNDTITPADILNYIRDNYKNKE